MGATERSRWSVPETPRRFRGQYGGATGDASGFGWYRWIAEGDPEAAEKDAETPSPKPPKVAGTYAYESAPVATRKRKGKKR